MLNTLRSSHASEDALKEDTIHRERTSRPDYEFLMISEHLCQLSMEFADEHWEWRIDPMSVTLVKQILRMSLQKDPTKRCGDVSKLPFTYSKHR